MIIPTGIGCELGGHAGDANAAARLLGAAVDRLILHPNVVNASDINEMPANSLYVEGSLLDDFLAGDVGLRPVLANKLLVVCNEMAPGTVNAVNAARVILGLEADVIVLDTPLTMTSVIEDGRATGEIGGEQALIGEVSKHEFDALAIHTGIDVERSVINEYLASGGINPWGGVEAKLSKICARALGVPVAHAPTEPGGEDRIVDPRIAAEMISASHLFSVLKGLHKAPRPVFSGQRTGDIFVGDVDVLVSPMCWGLPHEHCLDHGIPIIFVEENKTTVPYSVKALNYGTVVGNYIEAAGLLIAMREGISPDSLRRPMKHAGGTP